MSETTRKVEHMLAEIQQKNANLPALIRAVPEAGYTLANDFAIADRPCDSCGSILVSKKTPLGYERASWLRENTGSSLRIEVAQEHAGDGYRAASISCCAGGGCNFSLNCHGFAKLARLSLNDDAEWLDRMKKAGLALPQLSPYFFAVCTLGGKRRVNFSRGYEFGAVDRSTQGAAGVECWVQRVEAFSPEDAEKQIDVDAWLKFRTDATGRLPISWHGGPPRGEELNRQAKLDQLQTEADERDIDAQLAKIRKTLTPRRKA